MSSGQRLHSSAEMLELPPATFPSYFTSACLGLRSKTTICFPGPALRGELPEGGVA